MSLISAKEIWSNVSRACNRAAQGLGNSHVTRTTLQITCQGQVALTDSLTGTWPDYVQQLFRTEHVNEREVRLLVAALVDHVLNDHRARHVTDVIAGFHLANQIAQSLLPNLAVDHASPIDRHSLLTAALTWTRDTSDRCQIEDWIQHLALNTFRCVYHPHLPFMERVRFVEGVGKSSRDSAVLSGLLIEQAPSVTVPPDALIHESRVIVVSATLHGTRTKTRVKQSVAAESDLSRAQQLVTWLSRAGPRVILCAQWDIPSDVLALIRLHNFTERHVNQRPDSWILVWSYVPGDLLEDIALYSNCHIVTHIDLDQELALPFIGNVEQVIEYPLSPNRALYWMSSPSRAASLTSVVIRGPSTALRQHVKQQLVSHLSRLEHVIVSRDSPATPPALIDFVPEKRLDELLQSYCYQSRDPKILAHASDMRAWSRALLNLVPEQDSLPYHVTVAEKIETYTRATELACQILKIDQGILYDQ
jgi:hypothetical protein